jgi:hypothetical protein
MEYLDIIATGVYWYALGGVAILIGSVVVYGLALSIYRLLARLIALFSQLPAYTASHTDGALKRHHPF